MKPATPPPQRLAPPAAAEYLGISLRSLYTLLNGGCSGLRRRWGGGGSWR